MLPRTYLNLGLLLSCRLASRNSLLVISSHWSVEERFCSFASVSFLHVLWLVNWYFFLNFPLHWAAYAINSRGVVLVILISRLAHIFGEIHSVVYSVFLRQDASFSAGVKRCSWSDQFFCFKHPMKLLLLWQVEVFLCSSCIFLENSDSCPRFFITKSRLWRNNHFRSERIIAHIFVKPSTRFFCELMEFRLLWILKMRYVFRKCAHRIVRKKQKLLKHLLTFIKLLLGPDLRTAHCSMVLGEHIYNLLWIL